MLLQEDKSRDKLKAIRDRKFKNQEILFLDAQKRLKENENKKWKR